MTEAEWLACNDPTPMLEFLRGNASDRKLRLLAIACIRQSWRDPGGEDSMTEMVERYSEGEATLEELRSVFDYRDLEEGEGHARLAHPAPISVDLTAQLVREAASSAASAATTYHDYTAGKKAAAIIQSRLLRDIFGNPFRPMSFDASWLTPQLVVLAQAIYDERGFDRMPELAGALEAAGCNDTAILDHCRGPGPHVRGCWVLDLIRGK